MQNKVFIVYHNFQPIKELIEYINEITSDISIAKKFTTVNEFNDGSHYYLNQKEVGLALKNNSLLYVLTDDYVSTGITVDDFYNCDIFILTYKEYNAIADIIFAKYPILTVWVDSTNNDKNMFNSDLYYEIQYLEKRLETVEHEYYLNDPIEEIANKIIKYLNKNETN